MKTTSKHVIKTWSTEIINKYDHQGKCTYFRLGYTQQLNYSESTKDVNPYEHGCISNTTYVYHKSNHGI